MPMSNLGIDGIIARRRKTDTVPMSKNIENCTSAERLPRIETLQQYGLALQGMGELDLAISVYQRILELDGDNPDVRFNIGAARLQQTRPTEALQQFKAAARLKPEESGLHLGMANAHKLLGDLKLAESYLRKELEIYPESVKAAVNLGWLLEEQNRVPEALVQYRKAMYYNLNDVNLRWNHGLACLTLGDYARGWRDYEYRWAARNKQKPPYNTPEWKGEHLSDRTLLIYTEQGFGDSIMFGRFALQLGEKHENIVLHCQPALKRLLMKQPGLRQVTSKKDLPPKHDVHASLMSLPYLMQLKNELELGETPYLQNSEFNDELPSSGALPGEKRIAIAWASAPDGETSEKKSIPYVKFRRLFNAPNCRFYSVQVDAEATAIADMNRRANVHDLSQSIIDFEDTTAILGQMDLVISVDTAVAHLAGALGRPTWTLLPYAADWRWRVHRTDSPWYGTMRLFRQQRAGGDWDHVLEEVSHCLFNYGAQMSTSRLAGSHLLSA